MQDFEGFGVFYLGRGYDPARRASTNDLVLYDSKDLVTHALCVGMTGSGKTGLCIDLIEEAAIDGVPAIVIDPKGDLSDLLLTFPSLAAADFEPWVDEDDARRAGKSRAEFAAAEAEKWKKGLAAWGQDGARIQRLREAAAFTIYTPGSAAGRAVSVMRSFDLPAEREAADAEALRQRIETTVSSVLALAGLDVDPVKSREHLLLSAIVQQAWAARERLDLAALVQRVQQPPVQKIGVIDVDAFYPPKDRFELAMAINALIAAPGFVAWLDGEPLDAGAFLRTPAGKPRVSIFSIAHLDDRQRMFFVSLLLNAVVSWMRAQAGTSSLRAIVYMDEIAGYFPPVANPPSKPPLLTLLKQARAFGVGLVLATQNPADLDYKGLGNIGTWWLGRLQTERDKARVLDGLEGAAAGAMDRARVDALLSSLTTRVFLMRNVHEDALDVFESRWALSYLRGPLSRDEIKRLTAGASGDAAPAAAASESRPPRQNAVAPSDGGSAPASATAGAPAAARPVLPPEVPQFFAPARPGASYTPRLYGAIDIRFTDTKLGVDVTESRAFTTDITDSAVAVNWEDAAASAIAPEALERAPAPDARFAALPSAASRAKNYEIWSKQLVAWACSSHTLTLLASGAAGERSKPGESERDFRARLQQAARERRDEALEQLRKKYAAKQAGLEERLRRAQQAVDREASQATTQKLQTAISVGATLVTALFGRKGISQSTIGRATTAARGVGRTMKDAEDVQRAQETVQAVQAQLAQLDAGLRAEADKLRGAGDPATDPLDTVTIKPKKTNVTVKLVALVWTA